MAGVKKVVNFDGESDLLAMKNALLDMTKNHPMAARELTNIMAAAVQVGLTVKTAENYS